MAEESRDRRLIEHTLPLHAISEQSAREKSIRHGHISTLHIWWARRPLAAMRAAIFAALIPAPESDEERKELEDLIATIVDWDQVKDGNSRAIEKARALIHEAYPDGPPKLLDPFMGGGATGLEALRLGCETHAVELNPVAHLIELCTLVYPQLYGQPEAIRPGEEKPQQRRLPGQDVPEQTTMDLPMEGGVENPLAEDVKYWGNWVLERACEEIGHLYENPKGDETIVGYLWARTVTCPNPACRAEIPLVRQWWLAKRRGRRIALRPKVDREAKQVSFEVVDLLHDEVGEFDPSTGSMRKGTVTCVVCGQSADGSYLRQEGKAGRMGQRPIAVIYDADTRGKGYRPASRADAALYSEAHAHRQTGLAEEAGLILQEPIDPRRPSAAARGLSAVTRYGMSQFSHLFNTRQLLALHTFSGAIKRAYGAMVDQGMSTDQALSVATYLGLAVDRLADRESRACRWDNTGESVMNTFARQALPMVWDYVEVNPFSGSTGDWTGALDWMIRVIEHASSASASPASATQGTATRLPCPDDYLDAVVTDPPYYDAIPYADISDFFYLWLKRSLGWLYPQLFRTPLTPKAPEIIQHTARHGGDEEEAKAFYEREMTLAFAEIRRVVRPEGIAVIVFAHKSLAAWETLIQSLLNAGLVVTASWPLHTEMSNRIRAQGTASLASSIFIVCRVRAAEADGYFDDVREALGVTIRERLDFFWNQGIRGADFFISAIGPAVAVFGQYSQVYRLDGSQVGVGDLLELVQEMVADYALNRILNGAASRVGTVDPATRYYILHRWAYGDEHIPFDDAMRLAMALGADVTALIDRGIVKQYGEDVRLQGAKQRTGRHLGEPDRTGMAAPTIDVVHRAVVLWEQGNRDELAQFLAKAAPNRGEEIGLVAQTLVNILPDGDGERRLLEGFLAGRDVLPEVGWQERLF